MSYTVYAPDTFYTELGRAPKKVQHAWDNHILYELIKDPVKPDPPRIKKLEEYKNFWRFRISGDYRLVYRVNSEEKSITLFLLDHRSRVYERLRADQQGKPNLIIVAKYPDLLEKTPTDTEIGMAKCALLEKKGMSRFSENLSFEKLIEWEIPEKYHSKILNVATEDDFLSLSAEVPSDVLQKIMDKMWPPMVEEIVQQPVRIVSNLTDILHIANGEKGLQSLLLKLDDEQKSFVTRFEKDNPKGPWLLKGGPGSGKSTVALYCIKNLVTNTSTFLPGFRNKLQILYTTYTNSLLNTSDSILREMGVSSQNSDISVKTPDKLSVDIFTKNKKRVSFIPDNEAKSIIQEILSHNFTTNYPFKQSDADFLLDEIIWVIIGQEIKSLDEYEKITRVGRKRALRIELRREIWHLYEVFIKKIHREGKFLWKESFNEAKKYATPDYDYVFIDEAQDLTPAAIRFLIRLCKNPENIFITADSNQSIYGNGISWTRIAEDLNFTGRARILRKNFRTTKEIWEATKQILPLGEEDDKETFDSEPVFSGEYPILYKYSSQNDFKEKLNRFLRNALKKERLIPQNAVILCPSENEMKYVVPMLDPKFNGKIMKSRDFDISHQGVKITTMHAAKGLQFPVVAVVGLEGGKMPFFSRGSEEWNETSSAKQRRLFFVACSRAMKHLGVFCPKTNPSQFVNGFTDDYWDIEE